MAKYVYASITKLSNDLVNGTNIDAGTDNDIVKIETYGRVFQIRSYAKLAFITLRKKDVTLQLVCNKKVMGEQFVEICKLPKESNVIVRGTLVKASVKSCSYKTFELVVDNFELVNTPTVELPFDLESANMSCEKNVEGSHVLMNTRLTNRVYDLRTPFNKIINKAKTQFVAGVRKFLITEGFTEIFTPKLLGACSESGAEVFKVDYFGKDAYLAQSPQLYKQMLINADEQRVFTISDVYRAENSLTHRHLCEFVGLDIEMELDPPFNYIQAVNMLWSTVYNGYNSINSELLDRFAELHDYTKTVIPKEPLVITFSKGVELLAENGTKQDPNADLGTTNEKKLGDIVKEKYGSDLFVLTEYPYNARPFYTMKLDLTRSVDPTGSTDPICPTKSYDFILRGREILSGAQREHREDVLEKQVLEKGFTLGPFKDYLDSFKLGSPPHGGGGFGLERIITNLLGLANIRYASLFPRDPHHVTP